MPKIKLRKKRFEVVVDMHPNFDASFLRIALIGMMIKVISVKEITHPTNKLT